MTLAWYHYVGLAVVAIVAFPALLVGGGFLIPLLVAAVVGIAVIGGPRAWELYNNKRIGEKSGRGDIRALITPDDDGGASVESAKKRRGKR
jgi:hypothetical protein